MANNVFANGRELSCKSGSGKSICAFPDVCFTPPECPATPPGVPIPYPNTGMTSDTTSGSKSVKISGKEVMLKNKSYFKKSTGDEAGCAAKKGVLTSVNRGKVYFTSWSMDVKIEGQNVVRHLDLTTHNHASMPGNTPTWPFVDTMAPPPVDQTEKDKCKCCKQDKHSAGDPVDMDTWYTTNNMGTPVPGQQDRYDRLMQRVQNRKADGCTCNGRVVPEAPCNQFYNKTTTAERNEIKRRWNDAKSEGAFPDQPDSVRGRIGAKSGEQVNHLVPKAAGGCPDNPGNLQAHEKLCAVCKQIDADFGKLQSKASTPPA